jgi:hypothetical protein
MKLVIEQFKGCGICHPETCSCPDYLMTLDGKIISQGDREYLESIKNRLEQWKKGKK